METTVVAGLSAKIGLVDDDASIRKSVVRLLRSHGYACKAYHSGEMALADPELLKMDCLLIDIQLEGISGIELRDRVLACGIPMPHIFISACAAPDWRVCLQQMGSSPCLGKPFEEWELIALLDVLLQSKTH
jgi:FixJ family two-component response regulator